MVATILDNAHFDYFAAFHDTHCPDIYWSSTNIAKDMERCRVFVINDGERIVGSILCRLQSKNDAEIFAVAVDRLYNTQGIYEALVSSSVQDAFALGGQYLLFFIEEGADMELEAALKVGFSVKGRYRGFRVEV